MQEIENLKIENCRLKNINNCLTNEINQAIKEIQELKKEVKIIEKLAQEFATESKSKTDIINILSRQKEFAFDVKCENNKFENTIKVLNKNKLKYYVLENNVIKIFVKAESENEATKIIQGVFNNEAE